MNTHEASELPDHHDPKRVETDVSEYWERIDAVERARQSADGEPLLFVDGPPNTSGRMHCGTAWGKILKDAFLRYYRMQGRDVRARPGYDTHGLPVERRVEAALGVDSKRDVEAYGVDRFVEDCRQFVTDQQRAMSDEFVDLGVWMDWTDPYRTMDREYVEVVWSTFEQLYERDLLERERRIVNTCPDCETSVAETRLDYETRTATAAYVGFPLVDDDGWLLTWTTTPWTVTANQFVAVDREATYVAVETADRLLYLAADCLEATMTALDVEGYAVRDSLDGQDLVGTRYENPLAEWLPASSPARGGTVEHAPYVDLEHTGLVHSAPGFGEEDFRRGRELGLPAYAPLTDAGRFSHATGVGSSDDTDPTDDSPYEGQAVDALREAVLQHLDASNALLATVAHEHEYPCCPRCDSHVVYRAAEQWVLQVSTFKDDLLAALEETRWYPADAREDRFRPMVEDAPDWNVSRQRYWGTPVPVWVCRDCDRDVVVSDGATLAERAGLDAPPEDLHRPTVDEITVRCPTCGGTTRREEDVLDVWFDSSVASWASERVSPPETPSDWPADLVVEGHDQTRGWFLMQLYMGVVFADRAPYEDVVMHGFATLDGRAMSKSSGHVLRPPDVVAEYGRDAFRGHLLSVNPATDVNLDSDLSGVETVADRLDVVWNLYRFGLLYMGLDDHVPRRRLETAPEERTALDDWVLSRLQTTVQSVQDAMAERRPDWALEATLSFLLEDVSRYYVQAVRDRVWDGDRGAYDTLGTVLHEGTRLLAPFTPFLAERLYQALNGDAATVHATRFPVGDDDRRDEKLERRFRRVRALEEATATARQRAGRKGRWPVARVVVETTDDVLEGTVEDDRSLLESRLNAREVRATPEYDNLESILQPRMDRLGPTYGEDAPAVADAVRNLDPDAIPTTLALDGERYTVTSEMVEVRDETPEDVEGVAFEYGTVYVDTSLTTDLRREGVYRDLRRRAQQLRDDLDVALEAPVVLGVETNSPLVRDAVETYHEALAEDVRADEIVADVRSMEATTEWAVEATAVTVGVRRVRPTESG